MNFQVHLMVLVAALVTSLPVVAQVEGDSLQKVQADFRIATKDRKVDADELSSLSKRLIAIADANPKTEEGFESLTWLGRVASRARNGRVLLPGAKKLMDDALNRQIYEYAETEHIEKVIMRLSSVRNKEEAMIQGKRLDAILKANQSDNVQALCLYARCMLARNLDRYAGPLNKNQVKVMMAHAARLKKKFGDKAIPNDRRSRSFADAIDPLVFEFKNLRIGCVAPDIKAKDLDGVEFSLSDYRGKVVVLDFWGDW